MPCSQIESSSLPASRSSPANNRANFARISWKPSCAFRIPPCLPVHLERKWSRVVSARADSSSRFLIGGPFRTTSSRLIYVVARLRSSQYLSKPPPTFIHLQQETSFLAESV